MDEHEEQQPVPFNELKKRWAQFESGSTHGSSPATPTTSSQATNISSTSSSADYDPSSNKKDAPTVLTNTKVVVSSPPSIEPSRTPSAPPIPPKPPVVAKRSAVQLEQHDQQPQPGVSLLAQQFEHQKQQKQPEEHHEQQRQQQQQSPSPEKRPQQQQKLQQQQPPPPPPPPLQEEETLNESGRQDPFCDEEMVSDTSGDSSSESGSTITSGDSEIDDRLVRQVQEAHIRYTSAHPVSSATENVTTPPPPPKDTLQKKSSPPPPPPPSKKYHRTVQQLQQQQQQQRLQQQPSPMSLPDRSATLPHPQPAANLESATTGTAAALDIPNRSHTIETLAPTPSVNDSSPPVLPPRPSLHNRTEGMPALPPRPSPSSLARSHTIATHHHHHHHPYQYQPHNLDSSNPLSSPSSSSSSSVPPVPPLPSAIPDRTSDLRRSQSTAARSVPLSQQLQRHNYVPTNTYPDFSNASRQPPYINDRERRIGTGHKGASRTVALIGRTLATGGHDAKVWDIESCQCRHSIHTMPTSDSGDNKIVSLAFAPTRSPKQEGRFVWAGCRDSDLLVLDTATGQIIGTHTTAHSASVTFVLRFHNTEMWTIDDNGQLNMWRVLDNDPARGDHPLELVPQQHTVAPKAVAALIVGTELWMSSGRTLDVFDPFHAGESPHVRIPNELGYITQLVCVPYHASKVFASHDNGKISVWDANTVQLVRVINVSMYGICSMACIGDYYLWAGYNTGMIYVYDTRPEHWVVIKSWKAHTSTVANMTMDDIGLALGESTLQVVSADSHGNIALWDGLLPEYWQDQEMQKRMREYCTYRQAGVLICSWNIDANKPEKLSRSDDEKVRRWLRAPDAMGAPEIIVVGIQEIVDLESKKQTARSLFASRKKIETLQEADELLTHRYTLWHDHIVRVVNDNYGHGSYKVIKTDQLVGLFSCILVRSQDMHRVADVDSTLVKTGMKVMNKSLHGNKGGIAIRFRYDHSSLCFVNCHLAAGQSHTQQRNADAEGILSTATFPDLGNYCDVFVNGGDGSMILDHEHCFLSGDLNYRIGMRRDKVLQLLAQADKEKAWLELQREDQLLKQRIINPLFKLLMFKESPIRFDPTYKYDPGTDFYDSSEKKRVPAWCDRILYRSNGAHNMFYDRHEVQASDHRPISGGFSIQVKLMDPMIRDSVAAEVEKAWWLRYVKIVNARKASYVAGFGRCSLDEATRLLEAVDWDVDRVTLGFFA